jgi:hypothetical protein
MAQDPFHIRVHEYEPSNKGEFTAELHTNYVAKGTTAASGSVAPTEDQLHLAYEFTAGVTPSFSIEAMSLNGGRPGQGFDFAGCKVSARSLSSCPWRSRHADR